MSTHARIGILHTDKSSDSIRCQWDGDPTYIAPILLRSYNDIHKAKALVGLGNISSLGDNIAPTDAAKEHTLDSRQKNTVVAYHRDGGELWKQNKPMHARTMRGLLRNKAASYIYLFDEDAGEWIYSEGMNMYIYDIKTGKSKYNKSANFRSLTKVIEEIS